MKALTLTLILFLPIFLLAQTDCQKYEHNPVLNPGSGSSWDYKAVCGASVIFDDNVYKMWYNGLYQTTYHIGYATSPDGINWSKADSMNPVLDVGPSGSWDDEKIGYPCVLFDGATYKMWYQGSGGGSYRIGYATSTDGISWTKHDNPVLEIGSAGSWDDVSVILPKVVFSDGEYIMLYSGYGGDNFKIGCARSTDGITWTKEDDNPVLSASQPWEAGNVFSGSILLINNKFMMWYLTDTQTGYATSTNGLNWDKFEGPVLDVGPSGDWDDEFAAVHSVYFDGEKYHMWYDNHKYLERSSIGYATSKPATIHYVPDDYSIIQDAIDAAVDGDTVIVEEGTYMQQFSFMGKAITVASRYYLDQDTSHISKTIIDGTDFGSADSASLVYFINGEDSTSVLSGLTLQNGLGTFDRTTTDSWRVGGAILMENSGATIKNSIIKNNTIISDADFVTGGGIDCFILPEDKNLIIEENIFANNQVKGDESWGGAFNCEDAAGSLLITKNIVSDNSVDGRLVGSGGGINITTGSSDDILIANNYIRSNKVEGGSDEGGGIAIFNIKVEILNNLLTENSCSGTMNGRGGGISVRYNSTMTSAPIMKAIIINNTLVRNYAEERGSGIFVYNIDADIMNNIIRDNEDTTLTQISFEGAAYTHVIEYSNIEGGLEGTGNIDVDPNFSDTSFCLLMEGVSECIDAGNPAEMYNDVSDPLASNAPLFPACGTLRNDMGAYGGPNSKWELVTDIEDEQYLIPVNAELSQNYPNPFNPSTIIKYDIPIESNVTLKVFDVLGREVTTLVNKRQKAGFYEVEWNAVNNSSGVYFYKILAGDFVETKKMLLLR